MAAYDYETFEHGAAAETLSAADIDEHIEQDIENIHSADQHVLNDSRLVHVRLVTIVRNTQDHYLFVYEREYT